MKMYSTSPACAVLTELRDRDGVKAITNYVGLPSTSEETKVLDPLTIPEVLNFKPTHAVDQKSQVRIPCVVLQAECALYSSSPPSKWETNLLAEKACRQNFLT